VFISNAEFVQIGSLVC